MMDAHTGFDDRAAGEPGPAPSGQAPVFILGCFLATGLIVGLGLTFGGEYVKPSADRSFRHRQDAGSFASWDGQWYERIADEGYWFDPAGFSSVAFFPAFPLTGRAVSEITGLGVEESLLISANACFLAALFVVRRYCLVRFPSESTSLADWVVVVLCLAPTSYFFRIAYTESLFLLLSALAFLGIERRWPSATVAAIIGAATATRSVGVGLVPTLLLSLWRSSPGIGAFLRRSAYIAPLSCWGLIAFMVYLGVRFGHPLAFVEAQAYLKAHPPQSAGARLVDVIGLEPIWGPLAVPGAFGPAPGEAFVAWAVRARLHDRVAFLMAAGLVALGAARRWLNPGECLAAACLLLIPYLTVGYGGYMSSMARYSAAVLPVYLVAGRLLCRAPGAAAAVVAGTSGVLTGVAAALFARWYAVY